MCRIPENADLCRRPGSFQSSSWPLGHFNLGIGRYSELERLPALLRTFVDSPGWLHIDGATFVFGSAASVTAVPKPHRTAPKGHAHSMSFVFPVT